VPRDASKIDESTQPLKVLGQEIRLAWRIVVCAIYILGWRTKLYIRTDDRLQKGVQWAAVPPAIILFLDVALFFLHIEITLWLGGIAIALLVPIALVLLLHRVEEAMAKEAESTFATAISPIFEALCVAIVSKRGNQQEALDDYVAKLLRNICDQLRKRMAVNVNVMFPDVAGDLRMVYLYPVGTLYDSDFSLAPGQGAAGYSFSRRKIVYIPSIRYSHGILVDLPELSQGADAKISFGLKPRLYLPIENKFEIFQSIVSLPIVSSLGTHAILNVDSMEEDAFNMHDINMLRAYAKALAAGIVACSA
jgi:hypothetical protein